MTRLSGWKSPISCRARALARSAHSWTKPSSASACLVLVAWSKLLDVSVVSRICQVRPTLKPTRRHSGRHLVVRTGHRPTLRTVPCEVRVSRCTCCRSKRRSILRAMLWEDREKHCVLTPAQSPEARTSGTRSQSLRQQCSQYPRLSHAVRLMSSDAAFCAEVQRRPGTSRGVGLSSSACRWVARQSIVPFICKFASFPTSRS